jgi:hypothetical protein
VDPLSRSSYSSSPGAALRSSTISLSSSYLSRSGRDAGVEELEQAGQAPVDAVVVCLCVGLLLGHEQLPLAERVHRSVRVLAQLQQRDDVNEVDGSTSDV